MIPDIKPDLKEMIDNIAMKNMYYGNRIPVSIIEQFEIEEGAFHCGVLVPYWLSALQYGRGPRRSSVNSNLWVRIYAWMERRNMFRRAAHGHFASRENKVRQAKALTWYINKFGNAQFRSKTFIDIYNAERLKMVRAVEQKFSAEISRITLGAI